MKAVSLEELLEAGCHFGHQVSRQNAKAKEYIFEARDKIHIIDLEKTKEGLEEAGSFVQSIAKKNGTLLVVGTKRQAQAVVEEEKNRLSAEDKEGMYFISKRWIGGTLTNFSEVTKNFKKLKDLTAKLKDPSQRSKFTKKEIADWDKDRAKLEAFYGGMQDMPATPSAVFIIDTHLEHVAAGEARRAGVPTVGITDTNADPTIISYPIPANDDAVGSLKLIIGYIFDAWAEGRKQIGKDEPKEAKAEKTTETKKEVKTEEKKAEAKAEKKAEAPKKAVSATHDAKTGEAKPAPKAGPVKKPAAKK
jgi:small subunit ribosomal protein S2